MYAINNNVLEENWFFLREVYDFCHKIRCVLNGFQDTCTCLQLMYLMRAADTLRVIQTASIIGYPDQAGMLCSSLWEMAHTIIYFSYHPAAVQKYLEASQDLESKMPGIMLSDDRLTWKGICEKNCNHLYDNLSEDELKNKIKMEYDIYKNLCGIKHSRPYHVNRLKKINDKEAEVVFGPYDVKTKRWDLLESGREILLATNTIITKVKNAELEKEQTLLVNKYISNHRKEAINS